MNFYVIFDVLLTFKVLMCLINVENVPTLNKTEAEQNFAALNTIFVIDVHDVKCFES